MKIKFNLMDFTESETAYLAIIGVWGDALLLPYTEMDMDSPTGEAQDYPVGEPVKAPIGQPAVAPLGVAPTIATVHDEAVAQANAVSKVDVLIAGRPLTKSVKVSDGPQVKASDEVFTRDGTMLVIEATVRGTAICIDEAGAYFEMPSGTLYSSAAAAKAAAIAEATPADTPEPVQEAVLVTTGEAAPEIEDAEVVWNSDALPEDYLLADLHEAGNKLKKAKSVAAVLSALNEVSPGTNRLSELPVSKRADLLAKFNAMVAA